MEEIIFVIELIVIIIDLICGTIMLTKTLKKELDITKKYFMGATLFFFTHSVCRTFYFLRSYFFKLNPILFNFGTFLGLLAVIFMVYSMETAIYTKSKHFFTYYGLACLVVIVIAMFNNFEILGLQFILWGQYAGLTVLGAVIVLVYFSYIFKSTDTVRNHFILMFIAALLFCLGEMGNTSTALKWMPWLDIGAPIIILSSLILIFISITKYYKE